MLLTHACHGDEGERRVAKYSSYHYFDMQLHLLLLDGAYDCTSDAYSVLDMSAAHLPGHCRVHCCCCVVDVAEPTKR